VRVRAIFRSGASLIHLVSHHTASTGRKDIRHGREEEIADATHAH